MKQIHVDDLTPISLRQASTICFEQFLAEKRSGVRITPIFLGAPGQGKTAIVEDFAQYLNNNKELYREALINRCLANGKTQKEAEEIANQDWVCISYRLAQCDPTDLKGVPVYTSIDGAEMCTFAPPMVFPMEGLKNSAHGKNVLIFLDEVPQANPSIQNLAANIIDGKVGDYTIDICRSFIVCAGNRKEDKAATYDIPRNVGNRLVKFNVRTTFPEWEEWAINHDINPLVVGFLKSNQNFFNEAIPDNGYTYGTPRSWHKLSCQVNSLGEDFLTKESYPLYMIQGTVGMASANIFYQYAKTVKNKYAIEDIIDGKAVSVPSKEERDMLYSIVLQGVYTINNWVLEAISDANYQTAKTPDRNEAFIKALGPRRVNGISNIYLWLDQPGIDPAFKVLINKYQRDEIKSPLRGAMSSRPEFKDAFKSYTEIVKALARSH